MRREELYLTLAGESGGRFGVHSFSDNNVFSRIHFLQRPQSLLRLCKHCAQDQAAPIKV